MLYFEGLKKADYAPIMNRTNINSQTFLSQNPNSAPDITTISANFIHLIKSERSYLSARSEAIGANAKNGSMNIPAVCPQEQSREPLTSHESHLTSQNFSPSLPLRLSISPDSSSCSVSASSLPITPTIESYSSRVFFERVKNFSGRVSFSLRLVLIK